MIRPSYPANVQYSDFVVSLQDNDTLVWTGQVVHLVDNDGKVFDAPSLSFDPPWWHCKTCLDAARSRHVARASIGSKFCSECGTELDWDHMEEDEDSVADETARVRAALDQVVAAAEGAS